MYKKDGSTNTAVYWFESVPLVRFGADWIRLGILHITSSPPFLKGIPDRGRSQIRVHAALSLYPYCCLMASHRHHHSSETISITMHAVPSQAWRKALSPRQANHLCRRILCVRPLYVPGAGGPFHANLQATGDMYLYLSHALVSLLPHKLRTPKENISSSTRELWPGAHIASRPADHMCYRRNRGGVGSRGNSGYNPWRSRCVTM